MIEERTAPLPVEIVGPSSLRRLCASVSGVLILWALANSGAFWFLHRRPVNHGYRVIEAKWRLLETQERAVDWLVLGDSSGNQGVVPEILTEHLGGTSLNLCTVGGLLALHDAWMLERYVRAVGAPRGVLIVHAYDMWHRDPNLDAIAQVPLPLGYWRNADPPLDLTVRDWGRVLLDRYVPLYSQDQSLSRLLASPGKVLGRSFEMDERGYYMARRPLPQEVRDDAAHHLRFVAANRFSLSDANLAALKTIARMASGEGFDVYLAPGPLYEGLYSDPAFRAYFGRVEEALAAFAAAHPRMHVLGGEPITFRADEMTNVDHLIDGSARRYTAFLAGAIVEAERAGEGIAGAAARAARSGLAGDDGDGGGHPAQQVGRAVNVEASGK